MSLSLSSLAIKKSTTLKEITKQSQIEIGCEAHIPTNSSSFKEICPYPINRQKCLCSYFVVYHIYREKNIVEFGFQYNVLYLAMEMLCINYLYYTVIL